MLFGFLCFFPVPVVDISLCHPGVGFQAYGIHNTTFAFPPAYKGLLALGAARSCEPSPFVQDGHFVFQIVVAGLWHRIFMGLGVHYTGGCSKLHLSFRPPVWEASGESSPPQASLFLC